jgi:hypothetical protein
MMLLHDMGGRPIRGPLGKGHLLFENPVVGLPFDHPATHGQLDVSFESFSVISEIISRLLVEGIRSVGLEEEEL